MVFAYSATLDICTRKGIERSIILESARPREKARKHAIAIARRMRRQAAIKKHTIRKFFSLFDNEGMSEGKKTTITPIRATVEEITCHEAFHTEISSKYKRPECLIGVIEEGSALAVEGTTSLIHDYFFARYVSLFLREVAAKGERNEQVRSIIKKIRENAMVLSGDSLAVAYSLARDYAMFLECRQTLKIHGAEKGREVLLRASIMEFTEGFKEARLFLIEHLDRLAIKRIRRLKGSLDLPVYPYIEGALCGSYNIDKPADVKHLFRDNLD